MATDPDAPALLTLDRSGGSGTTELYRAALGPIHTDYYLKAFTRFDAAGKSGPQWNWTAALLGPNWLMFRQLWSHALAYVGALTAALLLFFGIGRLVFALSDASQWALMAGALLLAVALPGALGNAWLYAACNRRIDAALAATPSTEEACAQLALRASGRKHQAALATGNLALLAAIAALALVWPHGGSLQFESDKMAAAEATGAAPVELGSSGLAAQSVATATVAPASSAAATRISEGLVHAAATMGHPTAPPEPAASATAPVASAPVASQPAEGPKALPRAEALAPPSGGSFLINVGLFADADNARKASAKLRVAGLPVLRQMFKTPKGAARTRVRVGPFNSQAEAEAAAATIRSLQLDAAIVKN
jgi:cell division septation protein DedD